MTLTQWSWFLTIITASTIWISYRWSPWGWGVGVLAQIPWAWYAVETDQLGFIGACLIIGGVYANNFWKAWHGTDKGPPSRLTNREPLNP